jgi:hypothetical protein
VTEFKLKHVDRFKDRHGRVRYYFRRDRGARTALPGEPGSDEFMTAYQAALEGQVPPPASSPRNRGAPGTFDDLVQRYFASSDFSRLAPATSVHYRLSIERIIRDEKIGHRLVREMTEST